MPVANSKVAAKLFILIFEFQLYALAETHSQSTIKIFPVKLCAMPIRINGFWILKFAQFERWLNTNWLKPIWQKVVRISSSSFWRLNCLAVLLCAHIHGARTDDAVVVVVAAAAEPILCEYLTYIYLYASYEISGERKICAFGSRHVVAHELKI